MRNNISMKQLSILSLCLLGFGNAAQANFDHSIWDGLLHKHVVSLRGGQATQVDYKAFSTDKTKLTRYLQALSTVSRAEFDTWKKPAQLAFLINAYNAQTVSLVLTGYPKIKSIKDLGSLWQSPWKKQFFTLLGKTRSLDDVEHGLIRGSGRYHEPRIHFAVNCASVGCPALRAEAFVATQLDAQLDNATRLFLADRSRNKLTGNTLQVSSIFKWYRQDFEQGWRGADSLAQFLGLYAEPLGLNSRQATALKQGAIKVDFLPYDWRLNQR